MRVCVMKPTMSQTVRLAEKAPCPALKGIWINKLNEQDKKPDRTYLVSNNPDTSEVKTLEPPVYSPKGPAEDLSTNGRKSLANRLRLSEGVDEGRSVPENGSNDEIASHVAQAAGSFTDEETRWDGSTNFTERPPIEKQIMVSMSALDGSAVETHIMGWNSGSLSSEYLLCTAAAMFGMREGEVERRGVRASPNES